MLSTDPDRKSIFTLSVAKGIIAFNIILFVLDGLVALLGNLGFQYYRLSLLPRAAFYLFGAAYLLKHVSTPPAKNTVLLTGLLIVTFTIGYTESLITYNITFPLELIIAFTKYTYFFIVCATLFVAFSNNLVALKSISRWYTVFVVVNSTAIITGYLLNIDVFRSYPGTQRFGYKGLIFAVNETSVFYVVALLYAVFDFHHNKRPLLLILISAACFLIGTKIGFLAPFIVFIAYLLFVRLKPLTAAALAVLIAGIGFFLVKSADITQILHNVPSLQYFLHFYNTTNFMDAFTSGRNIFVAGRFIPYISSWSIINWLFGGTDITAAGIEMDFHDTFLLFGIIGGFVYLSLMLVQFFSGHRSRFAFLTAVIWVGFAAIGGHFFYSSVNAMYLSILLLCINGTNFPSAIRTPHPQRHPFKTMFHI